MLVLCFGCLQTTELRLQESQDRLLSYERRSSDHTKLIAELTQKVSDNEMHITKILSYDPMAVIRFKSVDLGMLKVKFCCFSAVEMKKSILLGTVVQKPISTNPLLNI